jgi:hypothetical protein
MTDEQINIAIAEACGWKGNLIDRDMEGNLWPRDIPSYCNDLNAMHEVEGTLSDAVFERYYLALYDSTGSTRWPVSATARQRAEAFLRTLGKWEE